MNLPKAKKLPSGNWFIRMRLGGVSVPVTAPTEKECKRQAALIKAEYQTGKRKISSDKRTLGDYIDEYIDKYTPVLSPATIRGYVSVRENRFQSVMDVPFSSVKDWQGVINEELKTKSPHTVRNGWGVVTAALNDAGVQVPDVKLAREAVKEIAFLEPEEIPLFLRAAEGDICEIEMLLELHGLRRSEVLAVLENQSIDVKRGIIAVNGAIVPDRDHQFVKKATNKTKASSRNVPIMIPRLAELAASARFARHSTSTMLQHVHNTCKKAGVTDVTNHGLRHTFASLGYSLGLSERAIMELGGWDDPGVMHKIYIRVASRDKSAAQNAISDFYGSSPLESALKELAAMQKSYGHIEELKPVFEAFEKIKNANEKYPTGKTSMKVPMKF